MQAIGHSWWTVLHLVARGNSTLWMFIFTANFCFFLECALLTILYSWSIRVVEVVNYRWSCCFSSLWSTWAHNIQPGAEFSRVVCSPKLQILRFLTIERVMRNWMRPRKKGFATTPVFLGISHITNDAINSSCIQVYMQATRNTRPSVLHWNSRNEKVEPLTANNADSWNRSSYRFRSPE